MATGHKDIFIRIEPYPESKTTKSRRLNPTSKGARSAPCIVCGKTFTRNDHLKSHMRTIHNGARSTPCEICGKTFSQEGNLREHMNIVHRRARSLPCVMCGKLFSYNSSLKLHIKTIHGGIRSAPCKLCGKTFSQNGNLREHMHFVHGNVKRIPCDICGKTFSYKSSLTLHIKTIHNGIRTAPCKVCGKTFSQIGNLREHVNFVHGNGRNSSDAYRKISSRSRGFRSPISSVHSEISLDDWDDIKPTVCKIDGLKLRASSPHPSDGDSPCSILGKTIKVAGLVRRRGDSVCDGVSDYHVDQTGGVYIIHLNTSAVPVNSDSRL